MAARAGNRSSGAGLAPIVRLGTQPNGDLFTIGNGSRSCSARYLAYANDGKVTASANNPIDLWFPNSDGSRRNQWARRQQKPLRARATPSGSRLAIYLRLSVICVNAATTSTRNSGITPRGR